MPIFEFECQKCHRVFEALVRNSQSAQLSCDKCGSKKLRKLVSAFGFTSGGANNASGSSSSGSSCGSCRATSCRTCH